jgi:hypothetical protein
MRRSSRCRPESRRNQRVVEAMRSLSKAALAHQPRRQPRGVLAPAPELVGAVRPSGLEVGLRARGHRRSGAPSAMSTSKWLAIRVVEREVAEVPDVRSPWPAAPERQC